MAQKITVVVSGGNPQTFDAVGTVGDLKARLGKENYIAKVNGESADDDQELNDYEYVTLAENVKGGC